MKTIALAIALLSFHAIAEADTGTMVERVPPAVDKVSALTIVQNVFTDRGWTISAADAVSVSGNYVASQMEARVRIFMDSRSLRYEESATVLDAARHGQAADIRTPSRWIDGLRSDIDNKITARAAGIEASTPAKFAPADRMTGLRKMRDSGPF